MKKGKNVEHSQCKVSVIIPSLNVAPYIKACMDSVINQTLREIEILVIDAGSTDGTLEILGQYMQDPRIHLIHSDKKSYGYQMNVGIEQARGTYISIVESDDITDCDSLRCLYKTAQESDADYVKGTASMFFDKAGRFIEIAHIIPHPDLKQMDGVKCVPKDYPLLFEADNFLWTGIYRKTFIKRFPFRETPGAAFQDISVLFRMISSAEKAVYLNQKVYYYRQDNFLASSYSPKSFQFVLGEYNSLMERITMLSKEWMSLFYAKLASLTINRFNFMAASGRYWEESETAIQEIRKILKNMLQSQVITDKDFTTWADNRLYEKLLLFIDNPMKLYMMLKEKIDQSEDYIREMIRWIDKYPVIIVGAGKRGQALAISLILSSVSIESFWDNDKNLWGNKIFEISVECPGSLIRQDGKYIIANKLHAAELKKQMLEIGIEETDIYVYQPKGEGVLLQRLYQ